MQRNANGRSFTPLIIFMAPAFEEGAANRKGKKRDERAVSQHQLYDRLTVSFQSIRVYSHVPVSNFKFFSQHF